jgi:hypothetical protein
VKRVEIEVAGVVAEAELNEDGAPRATAALWDALPMEARLEHTIWSGRACRFALPSLAAAGELENPSCSIYPGALVARPDRGEALIGYGAAEYRSALGVEYCTRLGRVVQNRAALLDVLARMHDEGDKRIAIRRAGSA